MKQRKYIIFVILLFISIGFAVLTSNLNINGTASFTDASFEVHFENAKVEDKNIDDGTITINNGDVTITSTGTFEKPGDYINTSFYVVNAGTMDAQLDTFSVSGLSTQLSNYFACTVKYDIGGAAVARGDILRAGQGRKINMHIEYKYNIEELSSISNLNITITMNYINPKKSSSSTVWDYEYTGGEQYFIASKAGNYKLEVWGAQGANRENRTSGFGGYSKGTLALQKGEKLYINVGGQGTRNCSSEDRGSCQGGYNGGGSSYFNSGEKWSSGGGATHIAKATGQLKDLSPNINGVGDVIIVAGGGGGAYNNNFFGSGGGFVGCDGNIREDFIQTKGATQTSGGTGERNGTFGKGGDCPSKNCTGGGGGYYGGAAGYAVCASGGSGYIGYNDLTNKLMYCYNCTESNETSTKTITTYNRSSTATSNYAKQGNGFAKITFLGNS